MNGHSIHDDTAIEAGLWFPYGRAKRAGITAKTTFDAVLLGERTSTTRFARWPGHDAWVRAVPGDLVGFHDRQDRTGRRLVVRVTSVEPIDLARCSEEALEAWSKREGWSPAKGRAFGIELGRALWVGHELVSPRSSPPALQMSLL